MPPAQERRKFVFEFFVTLFVLPRLFLPFPIFCCLPRPYRRVLVPHGATVPGLGTIRRTLGAVLCIVPCCAWAGRAHSNEDIFARKKSGVYIRRFLWPQRRIMFPFWACAWVPFFVSEYCICCLFVSLCFDRGHRQLGFCQCDGRASV